MSKNKDNNSALPATLVFEISGLTEDGDMTAAVVDKEIWVSKKSFLVLENSKIKPALAVGDQFVGKISKRRGEWVTKPLSRTILANGEAEKVYGIIEKREGRFYLKSSERNARMSYQIDNIQGAGEGDFVSVILAGDQKFKQVHIVKNFGKYDLNKATSALILEKYDLPHEFDGQIAKELETCTECDGKGRLDLTAVPLVTIDGEDSKDFDDAVWAERSENGFNLMVAIADVSYYVRPGSELDREAYRRGNSVYLPNMVVPMLPEKLSNDLCSLNPKQKRASIVCLMEINSDGKLMSYEFQRALIRSVARLTYREVQEALDGKKSANITPVYKQVVEPVYEAYQALDKARKKRGALELITDEIKIKMGKDGAVQSVSKDEVYISHKIVEEFMISANVAAALALKKCQLPVLYRVHDKPQSEKLTGIQPLLKTLDLKLPEQPALKPAHLNKLIIKCGSCCFAKGISDLVLRLQSQAQYSPENIGHFGLGLTDYVHFTSPIRRYADLLIHRTLVKAFNMPDGGGLEDTATKQVFEDIGRHLCETERKAVSAERDLTSRFLSAYLQPCVGQIFDLKITGIGNAGIFAQIEDMGAEGLIPLTSMPSDFYQIPDGNLEIIGEHRGLHLRMGDPMKGRLMEASPISGGLIFKFIDPEDGEDYFTKGGRRFAAAPKGGKSKKAETAKQEEKKLSKKELKAQEQSKKDKKANRKAKRKSKQAQKKTANKGAEETA